MIEGTMKKHKVKGLCKYIDVRMYSACPNKRGGIVELSGVGNPKNVNHIETFLTVGYPIGLSSYDTASRTFLLCKTAV